MAGNKISIPGSAKVLATYSNAFVQGKIKLETKPVQCYKENVCAYKDIYADGTERLVGWRNYPSPMAWVIVDDVKDNEVTPMVADNNDPSYYSNMQKRHGPHQVISTRLSTPIPQADFNAYFKGGASPRTTSLDTGADGIIEVLHVSGDRQGIMRDVIDTKNSNRLISRHNFLAYWIGTPGAQYSVLTPWEAPM